MNNNASQISHKHDCSLIIWFYKKHQLEWRRVVSGNDCLHPFEYFTTLENPWCILPTIQSTYKTHVIEHKLPGPMNKMSIWLKLNNALKTKNLQNNWHSMSHKKWNAAHFANIIRTFSNLMNVPYIENYCNWRPRPKCRQSKALTVVHLWQ